MKSVLVIDKPVNCNECYLYHDVCPILGPINDTSKISENCPLRDLPNREACNEYDFEHYRNGVSVGWNRCLEKITGEVPSYAEGYTGKNQNTGRE